jgi:hypothetical protein
MLSVEQLSSLNGDVVVRLKDKDGGIIGYYPDIGVPGAPSGGQMSPNDKLTASMTALEGVIMYQVGNDLVDHIGGAGYNGQNLTLELVVVQGLNINVWLTATAMVNF